MATSIEYRGEVVIETLSYAGSGATPPFTAVLSYSEGDAPQARSVRRRLGLRPNGADVASFPDEVTVDVFLPRSARGWVAAPVR